LQAALVPPQQAFTHAMGQAMHDAFLDDTNDWDLYIPLRQRLLPRQPGPGSRLGFGGMAGVSRAFARLRLVGWRGRLRRLRLGPVDWTTTAIGGKTAAGTAPRSLSGQRPYDNYGPLWLLRFGGGYNWPTGPPAATTARPTFRPKLEAASTS